MTQRERDVLKVMSGVLNGERTQVEAARLLKRSERQVRRLAVRMRAEGDQAVMHRLRGKPSNRRLGAATRRKAMELYKSRYAGFGPTLASEKLAGEHQLVVSKETLRQLLLSEGLWQRRRERDKHRARRERRPCFGEMVQADASEHDWLEGRGPRMVLVGMIDDATGKILARFYPSETTEARISFASSSAFAAAIVDALASLSSFTHRSCNVPHNRSIRPLAWGLFARINSTSNSPNARENCRDRQLPVLARLGPEDAVPVAVPRRRPTVLAHVPPQQVHVRVQPSVHGEAGKPERRTPATGAGPGPGGDPERAGAAHGGQRLHDPA